MTLLRSLRHHTVTQSASPGCDARCVTTEQYSTEQNSIFFPLLSFSLLVYELSNGGIPSY